MQFSNTTTEEGLIQEIDRICGSTNNTYSLKAKTARINQALDRFFTLALKHDGTWQFDDTNQADLPIGVADLVSAQQDYTFSSSVLFVKKVMVKDSGGLWREVNPVDITEDKADNIWTLPTDNAGTPVRYDKFANSLLLDPIPNYNSTGGLKVVFNRNKVAFVSTDTTKEPGVPSLFHEYLARYASLPYLIEKRLVQSGGIAALIQQDEREITNHFAQRTGDERSRVTPHQEDNK